MTKLVLTNGKTGQQLLFHGVIATGVIEGLVLCKGQADALGFNLDKEFVPGRVILANGQIKTVSRSLPDFKITASIPMISEDKQQFKCQGDLEDILVFSGNSTDPTKVTLGMKALAALKVQPNLVKGLYFKTNTALFLYGKCKKSQVWDLSVHRKVVFEYGEDEISIIKDF